MTAKDYRALAAALARTRPDPKVYQWEGVTNTVTDGISRGLWDRTRDAIADALAADNPRFDRSRFVTATEGAA